MCSSVENPDLSFQETGDSQGTTHSRLAECDPDCLDRVMSPYRDLPLDMQQVASTSNISVCNEVQQRNCLTGASPLRFGNGCA